MRLSTVLCILSCAAVPFATARATRAQACSGQAGAATSGLLTAECFINAGQLSDALHAILQYRKSNPESISAGILQGQILIEMHLLNDADNILKELAAIHPRSIEVLSFYADLSEKLGEFERAEHQLVEATELSPNEPRAWRALGNFYIERRNGKAVEAFKRAVRLRPQDPELIAGYAFALGREEQPLEALRQFELAEKMNTIAHSPSVQVDLYFASYLRETERYRESISYYSAVLRADPNLMTARLERGQSFMGISDWNHAEEDLRACSKEDRTRAQALPLLLRTIQAQKKSAEAEQLAARIEEVTDADLSVKATNNEIAAELRNAQALSTAGRPSEAAELYRQLFAGHPEAVAGWTGLGLTEARQGNLAAAESDFRRFLVTNENSPSAHFYLGNVLLQEHEPEKARAEFERVTDLDPLRMAAHIGLAASYIMEKNYRAAIKQLRSIKAPFANDPSMRLILAEALYKDNDKAAALDELDVILSKDPLNGDALRMRNAMSPHEVSPE